MLALAEKCMMPPYLVKTMLEAVSAETITIEELTMITQYSKEYSLPKNLLRSAMQKLMDLPSCLHTLKGHTDWITSAVFSPDGKTLASASSDSTIKLWKNKVSDVTFAQYLLACYCKKNTNLNIACKPVEDLYNSLPHDIKDLLPSISFRNIANKQSNDTKTSGYTESRSATFEKKSYRSFADAYFARSKIEYSFVTNKKYLYYTVFFKNDTYVQEI